MEPTNFSQSQYNTPLSEGTYSASVLFNDLDCETSLNDLFTTEYVLTKPIPTVLQYRAEDRCFVAIQNNLNLWGEAVTLQGAEKELAAEIVKLYKKLSELKTVQLGPYPLKLLSFLKRYIS